jgi:BirA family transcriptional regulator, biotin operon repressor / biotin---[acetyl-CoA-carboxylase] ligase
MQITAHAPTVLGVSPISTPLNEPLINNALNSAYWRVRIVEETGSTQTDLANEVRDGLAVSGTVLVAEHQTSGRGRLDRNFVAPPRSALLFSFFYLPHLKGEKGGQFGWLPLLASQAVHASIKSIIGTRTDISLSLKWPNDVLLNEKKVAGLLCERVNLPDAPGVIVGIGLNVFAGQEDLPNKSSTSLSLEEIAGVDRGSLLVSILQNMTKFLLRWEDDDARLIDEYKEISATVGRRVRVEAPSGDITDSIAVGIEPSGSLVLIDGTVISVGDVVHLRSE